MHTHPRHVVRRLLSAPRAAQIELATAAGWVVLGLLAGVALASEGGTVGTLWGTIITEDPPALLIGLNVLLAGLLLAVPFLAVGLVLWSQSRARALIGLFIAFTLAFLCIGGSALGTIVELQRSPSVAIAFDRVGGASVVFSLGGIVHAIAGVTVMRSLPRR